MSALQHTCHKGGNESFVCKAEELLRVIQFPGQYGCPMEEDYQLLQTLERNLRTSYWADQLPVIAAARRAAVERETQTLRDEVNKLRIENERSAIQLEDYKNYVAALREDDRGRLSHIL